MPFVLNLIYLRLARCSRPPVLIYRAFRSGKYREGWCEKLLGKAPLRIGDRPCVWFHAVSVGEVLLLRPLVARAGAAAAGLGGRRLDDDDDRPGRGPADLSRPGHLLRPARLQLGDAAGRGAGPADGPGPGRAGALAQPGLGGEAGRGRVAIINGRLSHRSHRGYRQLRGPLGPTLRRLDAVAAQTEEYAARFVDLGVPRQRVRVTGSVKYDGLESDRNNPRTLALRQALGLSPADLVFVAGSTMEGEEEAALAAYRAARVEHPRLRLVLVPRHAERFERVAAWLEQQGETVLRRSWLNPPLRSQRASRP